MLAVGKTVNGNDSKRNNLKKKKLNYYLLVKYRVGGKAYETPSNAVIIFTISKTYSLRRSVGGDQYIMSFACVQRSDSDVLYFQCTLVCLRTRNKDFGKKKKIDNFIKYLLWAGPTSSKVLSPFVLERFIEN